MVVSFMRDRSPSSAAARPEGRLESARSLGRPTRRAGTLVPHNVNPVRGTLMAGAPSDRGSGLRPAIDVEPLNRLGAPRRRVWRAPVRLERSPKVSRVFIERSLNTRDTRA